MSDEKKYRAGKNLSRIMAKGYMDLHQKAAQGAFCVWIAINVPAEIFEGFDNVVYAVPETSEVLRMIIGRLLSKKTF
ncbi:MAG: hypothetical protein HUN04_02025 [Desulfobacter sp.]|nr:MAG: hypothetical protein HUN04_02025 [Desulfobacter sp.]